MHVYVESYGCAQNQGEGHAIARDLHAAGHSIAAGPEGADAGILVSCAVIGSTEARMVERWRELTEVLPRVLVTGCLVPLRTGLLAGAGRDRTTFVPIRDQARIPDILGEGSDPGSSPGAPPADLAEEVVLAQGCVSGCTYCFSRLARGRLASVAPEEVVRRVRSAHGRGAVEIRLTSLDASAWGLDLDGQPRLPQLMDAVAGLPGTFAVRVGMMSPQTLAPIHEAYFRRLTGPRFFSFLHLPVQSGSDGVLASMHRGHTVADFRHLVDAGRAACPGLMLATDIITGFPTETEDDHRATLDLLRDVAPEVVNVTRFSARPGTPASRLEELPSRIAKRRSRELAEERQALARTRLEGWIGWEGSARILEHGSDGSSVARLPNYLPFILPERLSLGAIAPVRVEGARSNYLFGRRTGPAEALPPALPP